MDSIRVFVLGLGRIGLAHAVAAASSGHIVYGFDSDAEYFEALRSGRPAFVDDLWGEFARVLGHSLFLEVPEEPVDIVALGFGSVPGDREWPLRAAEALSAYRDIIGGATIIVRGTVHIGDTRRLAGVLSSSGWFRGLVYFAPERLVEGRALHEEKTLPVIYGGPERSELLEEYFSRITSGGVRYVGEWEVAEAVKLVNNTWRAATFALSNALFLSLERAGLDPYRVFEAAGWKYPRGKMPVPGYVSGYCLSKDPVIFDESVGLGRVRELLEANKDLIEWTLSRVGDARRVLVLGASYKWDVDDYRSSHALEIAKRLVETGKEVVIHDPYYRKGRYSNPPEGFVFTDKVECDSFDAIVVATPHSEYRGLECANKRVVDVWNITRETR